MEEDISSSLRNDIQLLNQRKLLLKKRKEKSCKLIEELEGTLQKCVEKLGIIGDGLGNDYYDDYCTEATLHFGGEDEVEDGDGIPGELPPTSLANDDASLFSADDDEKKLHVKNECSQGDSDCQGNVNGLLKGAERL